MKRSKFQVVLTDNSWPTVFIQQYKSNIDLLKVDLKETITNENNT